MKQREDKFSKHVGHLEEGGLNGWCAGCSPEDRHRAIETTVRQVGYAKTIERLDFVSNVASRKNNERTHQVAAEDIVWTEDHERRQDPDQDRPRGGDGYHEVEGHEAEQPGARPRWIRRHRARNPTRT